MNPLASLWQRRWVVHLHVLDFRWDWDLRRNAQDFSRTTRQGKPVPIEFWVHTKGPAQLQAWLGPDSGQQPDLALTLEGRVAFGHARHETVAGMTGGLHT